MGYREILVYTCDQCCDEERSREGEHIQFFRERLKSYGWFFPQDGFVWCSTECRDFQSPESREEGRSGG